MFRLWPERDLSCTFAISSADKFLVYILKTTIFYYETLPWRLRDSLGCKDCCTNTLCTYLLTYLFTYSKTEDGTCVLKEVRPDQPRIEHILCTLYANRWWRAFPFTEPRSISNKHSRYIVYVYAGVTSGANQSSAPPSDRNEDRKSTVVDLTNWTALRSIRRYRRQTAGSRPATATVRTSKQPRLDGP